MWPGALTFEKTVAHGESLDFSIGVPLSYGPGQSPLLDGSRFRTVFKLDPADADSFLVFETGASAPPFLTTGAWDGANSKLVLAYQASRGQLRALPPGVYTGHVIHERPRQGPLGPMNERVGVILLTVIPGA